MTTLFSPNTHNWAVSTSDGRLVVWDSDTAKVQQELVPSAHLAAMCTALAWKPEAHDRPNGGPTRKRMSNGGGSSDSIQQGQNIALGTMSGAVMVYCLKTGNITAHFAAAEKAHSGRVNAITWSWNSSEMFTASSDGSVGHFHVKKSVVLNKFRATAKKDAFHSVCLHPNQQGVLAGSTLGITWWDLTSKAAVKTFAAGHLGPVGMLVCVDPKYLISAGLSEQDHTLNVWSVDALSEPQCNPVSRMAVNDAVQNVSASPLDEGFALAAVTKSGTLCCFRHADHQSFNGSIKSTPKRKKTKPMQPDATLQLASEKDASGKVRSIAVLDAVIRRDEDGVVRIRLAYGAPTSPAFESLKLDSMEATTCLVRPAPQQLMSASVQVEGAASSHLVVPKTSAAVILAPGPSLNEAGRKRKLSLSERNEVSMMDRLQLLSKDNDSKTTPPRADSLLRLLLQGLNNKDRKILDSVLDRADEELIENTVRKLPVEAVLPLVRELQHYIRGRGVINQSHAKWLRMVLLLHTTHLISAPESAAVLGPVYALIEARTKNYHNLLQLKGKLDLMTQQITTLSSSSDAKLQNQAPVNEAQLVFHDDDSSDELSEAIDDLLLPESESEDVWQNNGMDDEESDSEEEDDDDDDDDEDGAAGAKVVTLSDEDDDNVDDDNDDDDDDDDDVASMASSSSSTSLSK